MHETFPLVGVVGAGPETRLAYAAANRLGLRFRVLAQSGRDSAARVVPDAVSGDVGGLHVLQAFAEHCAVVLIADPEVPVRRLTTLREQGVHVVPSAEMVELLDDRGKLADRLAGTGIVVVDPQSGPTPTVLMARSPMGQAVVYPVVELSVGPHGPEAVVPALTVSEDAGLRLQELALKVGDRLGAIGVLAVRFAGESVCAVEPLATSNGAWTLTGCVTDAFEQHLRAVLDLPLGDPTPVAPCSVTAQVVGKDGVGPWYPTFKHLFAHDPTLQLNLYGADVVDGVENGHVTVLGHDAEALRSRARHAAGYLRGDISH